MYILMRKTITTPEQNIVKMMEQQSHVHTRKKNRISYVVYVYIRRILFAMALPAFSLFIPNGQESQLKEHTLAYIVVGVAAMHYFARVFFSLTLAIVIYFLLDEKKNFSASADEFPILSAHISFPPSLFHIQSQLRLTGTEEFSPYCFKFTT